MRILHAALALAALLLATPVPGASQDPPTRVRFEAGKSAATLRGRVVGYGVRDYLVRAGAGQRMTVRLTTRSPSTVFMIYTPSGKELTEVPLSVWSGELPEAGDYRIRALMMRAAARRPGAVAEYTLAIGVDGAAR